MIMNLATRIATVYKWICSIYIPLHYDTFHTVPQQCVGRDLFPQSRRTTPQTRERYLASSIRRGFNRASWGVFMLFSRDLNWILERLNAYLGCAEPQLYSILTVTSFRTHGANVVIVQGYKRQSTRVFGSFVYGYHAPTFFPLRSLW